MLIVSCQAENNSPFNKPEYLNLFVLCAKLEGITTVRVEGIDNIKYISEHNPDIQIIGLVKSKYDNGLVKITRNEEDIRQLLKYTNIISIDGTFRKDNNLTGPEFIQYIILKYKCTVIADISNIDEALECSKFTKYISTTLSGYTADKTPVYPDYELVKNIHELLPNVILIAEGRYNKPLQANKAIKFGASHVCVGTAITRPQNIISWYKDAIYNIK